ncbi:MAG: hypothetical protein HYZ53_10260 [Planctomycetes bacterium]|nr:hypothetical protein [Planctomycetota bacterium]
MPAVPSPDRSARRAAAPHRIPLAYFITFRTYGTWLHGDTRGSVDRKHNVFGMPLLPHDPKRAGEDAAAMANPSSVLSAAQRAIVEAAVKGVCEHRGWILHALNVRTNHLHVVVSAQVSPERVMADFKAWGTRRLVEGGTMGRGARVWTRHGSTKYLWRSEAVAAACNYVIHGQEGDQLPVEPANGP